jgi:hypothetical protein
MPIRKYGPAPLPDRRVHGRASPALRHLVVAHATLQGIFESLHVVRLAAAAASGRDARGRLNEGQVDLLRSALVLAGAGLDAVIKRLAQDALPELLAVGSTRAAADKAFKTHVSAQIRDKTPSTSWTKAILEPDPRQAMIRLYVGECTRGSLQSEKDMRMVRDALGVAEKVITDPQIASLGPFLTARNQVAHDLDIKAPEDPSWGARHPRRITTVVAQCDLVLRLAGKFVDAVSDELGGPPPLGRPRSRRI